MKKKKIKNRNPSALPAKSRKSSGPMKNKKDKRKSNKTSDEDDNYGSNLTIGPIQIIDPTCLKCYNGDEYWYKNGMRHREDGPAIEWADGTKFWYYNGEEIVCDSQEEFEKIIKLRMFW